MEVAPAGFIRPGGATERPEATERPKAADSRQALVCALGKMSLSTKQFLQIAEALHKYCEGCVDVKVDDLLASLSDGPNCDDDGCWTDGLHAAGRILSELQSCIAAGSNPSESAIATRIGVSASHLGRVLTATTRVRFRQWRSIIRMKRAASAVLASDEQFAQIAYRVGFEYPTQFSREFRAFFGISPRVFRSLAADRTPASSAKSANCLPTFRR